MNQKSETVAAIEFASPNKTSCENDAYCKAVSEVLRAIAGISYGSVEIIIHDSKVVQIERREKFRFEDGSKCSKKGVRKETT